jgi:hypothetical protein
LETRTIQNLERLGHRRNVQKPTQISQNSQIDSVKNEWSSRLPGVLLYARLPYGSYLGDLHC